MVTGFDPPSRCLPSIARMGKWSISGEIDLIDNRGTTGAAVLGHLLRALIAQLGAERLRQQRLGGAGSVIRSKYGRSIDTPDFYRSICATGERYNTIYLDRLRKCASDRSLPTESLDALNSILNMFSQTAFQFYKRKQMTSQMVNGLQLGREPGLPQQAQTLHVFVFLHSIPPQLR